MFGCKCKRTKVEEFSSFVRLQPDEHQDLFDTKMSCTVSGLVNCFEIGGANRGLIEVFFYLPESSTKSNRKLYRYEASEIFIPVGMEDEFSPVHVLDKLYMPQGGVIRLTHINGVSASYYYDIKREVDA